MSVTTSYEIQIYYVDYFGPQTINFADRCTGFQIGQQTPVGTLGTGKAIIELLNNDGELTPGGGGTYSNFDWFNVSLQIEALVTGDDTSRAYLFHGIVTNIQFVDNGVNSTVTLEARDGFSVGGRTPVDADLAIPGSTYIFLSATETLESLYNGLTISGTEYIQRSIFPNLGDNNADPNINFFRSSATSSQEPQILDDLTNKTPNDIINNYVMPSMPGVAYPTLIERLSPVGIEYQGYVLENDLTKRTGTAANNMHTFAFAENPSTGELPFTNMERRFNVEELTNSAQLQLSTSGSTVQESQDTASIAKYGARNRSYTTTNQNDASAKDAAYRWSHRFSQARFTPYTLEITDRMVEKMADADDDIWEDLIDIRTGMWSVATIEFTPTGASTPITETCVIVGRTFKATPSQMTLKLDLLPAQDYQSFVLDSSTLGVLATNRLG